MKYNKKYIVNNKKKHKIRINHNKNLKTKIYKILKMKINKMKIVVVQKCQYIKKNNKVTIHNHLMIAINNNHKLREK